MTEQTKWLTNLDDILTVSDDDLVRSLITSDGKGKTFKEMCLKELMYRAQERIIVKIQDELEKDIERDIERIDKNE